MITALERLFKKKDIKSDYQLVFSTPVGERVLADIMRNAGVLSPQFTADPNEVMVHEGQRRLAYSIFRQVHTSMDPLLKQIAEEQRRNDAARTET